jgi:hypothetical protein
MTNHQSAQPLNELHLPAISKATVKRHRCSVGNCLTFVPVAPV